MEKLGNILRKVGLVLGLSLGILPRADAIGSITTGVPDYTEVQARITASGPTLLFSDSPENVYKTGVLYRDTITGAGRVFFHHVNCTKQELKIAILMRPAVDKPVQVTWKNRGIGGPSEDYYRISKSVQKDYFTPGPATVTKLNYTQQIEILTQSSSAHAGIILKPEELMTGMFDFETDNPVEISVLMCNPEDNILSFARRAAVQPMDEHPLRGTFKNANLTYEVETPLAFNLGKIYALPLGRTKQQDFVIGRDATTEKVVMNNGNYGVIYNVKFTFSGGEAGILSVNPWGGNFAGYGIVKDPLQQLLVAIPAGKVVFGSSGEECYTFATLLPQRHPQAGEFIWSPPGTSSLPIRLLWLPLATGKS